MIKFGTDGWRAIIAEEFTFQNVRYCAQSLAEHLLDTGKADSGILIGYDTRFASENFAVAAAEVMAGNGIMVRICPDPTPTPVISYGVKHLQTAGAVVITASHNPPEWNGFKIKGPNGSSATAEVEAEVEQRLTDIIGQNRFKALPLKESLDKGLINQIDLYPAYLAQIQSVVDLREIRNAGFVITVDSMFGAGAGYFKKIIGQGKTTVMEINEERNPVFPGIRQPEPIAPNLTSLTTMVIENHSHVGLATDGDADRIGIVDEQGHPLTPLQIFGLLTMYLLETRRKRGAIVKTINTTEMVNKLAGIYNLPVFETKIGFKHVAPVMMAEDALIGGEESSGFGYRGHIPERDGILSGLFFLDLMAQTGKSPSELIQHLYDTVGPHHYHREDIQINAADRGDISRRLASNVPAEIRGTKVDRVNTIDGHHFRLADGTWLLARLSGTEPLLRIYAEAGNLQRAKEMIDEGRKLWRV